MGRLIEVGIVGARGYAGGEFGEKLKGHPDLTEVKLDNRGDTFAKGVPGVVVLALPDNLSGKYIEEIRALHANPVIVDLSSDHRSDDSWVYGLTEHARKKISEAHLISNPGCYATGMQIGIKPALEFRDINFSIVTSGTSGYSGAGQTPSRTNNLDSLANNKVIPYKTVNHQHEKEVAEHLAIDRNNIMLMPRTVDLFRGMILEIRMRAKFDGVTAEKLTEHYRNYYKDESLIRVVDEWPNMVDAIKTDACIIGGFQVVGREMGLVVVLDNLGKGAAGQAMQNLNVALGLPETTGLTVNVKK